MSMLMPMMNSLTFLLLLLVNNCNVVSSFTIQHTSPLTTSLTTTSTSSISTNINTNINISHGQVRKNIFELYGRKTKGKLTQNVSSGSVPKTTNKNRNNKTNKNNKSNKNNKNDQVVQVSSSLSQWAAAQDNASVNDDDIVDNVEYTSTMNSESDNFIPFSEKKKSKNTKPKPNPSKNKKQRAIQKQTQNQRQKDAIAKITTSIMDITSNTNLNIQELLTLIQELIHQNYNTNTNNFDDNDFDTIDITKKIFNTKKDVYDYKLTWVGSDEAICHIGTGLHKVPLARLQDVFLTIGSEFNSSVNYSTGKKMKGKRNSNSITILEVIRILGPFPNVRNTLQGTIMNSTGRASGRASGSGGVSKNKSSSTSTASTAFGGKDGTTSITTNTSSSSSTSSANQGQKVSVSYDTMLDGLGKEIKAGDDSNVRNLDLNILYADENAIVAVVPDDDDVSGSDSGSDGYGFGENGKNVLLFLKEEDIDGKLDGLRAA